MEFMQRLATLVPRPRRPRPGRHRATDRSPSPGLAVPTQSGHHRPPI